MIAYALEVDPVLLPFLPELLRDFEELVDHVIGTDSGIGRIVVSHHSRSQKTRIRRAVERIDEPGPKWIAADPGAVLEI